MYKITKTKPEYSYPLHHTRFQALASKISARGNRTKGDFSWRRKLSVHFHRLNSTRTFRTTQLQEVTNYPIYSASSLCSARSLYSARSLHSASSRVFSVNRGVQLTSNTPFAWVFRVRFDICEIYFGFFDLESAASKVVLRCTLRHGK